MIIAHNGVEIIERKLTALEELEAMERKAHFEAIKADYERQLRRRKRTMEKIIPTNILFMI